VGEFAAARDSLAEACRLRPDDPMMAQALLDVRFAVGDFETIERETRSELEKTPLNIGLHGELLEALVSGGKDAEAGAAHDAFVQRANQPPGDIFQLGLKSQLQLHYLRGRLEEFQGAAQQITDPQTAADFKFQASLELGKLDNLAVSVNAPRSGHRATSALLLGLAWSAARDPARAADARQRAVAALAAGNRLDKKAAEHLQRAPAVAPENVETLLLEPDLKVALLLTLAELCPDQQPSL